MSTSGYNSSISATKLSASSSDTSVVSVGNDGKLTASAPGVAIITVKTADGGFAATCTVTVTQKSTNITLNKTELTIYSETTFTLVPTITPANSTDEITWETTNSKVATVSNKGVISGKAKGSTLIIAKTSSGLTAYCKVTVKQRAKGIELNYTTKTVAKGNKFTLKAAVLPLDASNKKVTFTSSNTKVATVNADGVVKGLKGGTTVITVETVDGGYKATCVVTVKELVTEISLKKDLMVAKGYVGTLKPVIKSNSATTTKIKWTSSNNKIVKVNQKGVITAVGYGTATITVRATDGSGAIAKCKVKVIRKVTSISINKTAVNIIVGDSLTVKATVKPNNSTYRGVIWSSSNENVAVVNDKGKITAIAEGNCIIYAKAKDNSKKSAKLIVTVTKKVASSGITVANQELTLVRGERKLVQTVLSPANTTDGIRWSSDNNAVATVDKKTGLIVAKSVGTAVITVMTDSGKTARITVTVVGLSKSSLTLEQYSTYTLWVEGAKNVKWDVENPNVATVVNGKVTSRAIGKTRIIASVNGRKLYCTLRVTKIA